MKSVSEKKQKPVRFLYIDDVFSLNNCKFGYFVDHIYLIEFEIKDTTYTDRSVAYLDIHLVYRKRWFGSFFDSSNPLSRISDRNHKLHMQVLLDCYFIYN
jgi:hypothetical protein